jgi:tetratricopeptide (TPR) repeat protein
MARPDFKAVAMLCACITLASGPVSAAEAQDEARAHYQRGATAYHEGRYDEAAREFQAAYDRDPRGPLLLNIAQAYRLRTPRDCGEALRHYELFLAAQPNASEKPEVTLHIAEMRACVKAEQATTVVQPLTPATTAIPAASQRHPATQATRPTAALWIMGAGLASAAMGGGLYLVARDRYSDLSARCPCPDDANAQGDIDRWESVAQTSYVLSGVGLAALVGAGAWWLFGAADHESAQERALLLHPVLLQGGAAVVAEGGLW